MPADSLTPTMLSDEEIAVLQRRLTIERGMVWHPYAVGALKIAGTLLNHALAASAALAEREGEIVELRASKEKLHRRAQAAEGPLDAVKAHGAEAYKQWVDSWHFEYKRFLAEKVLRETAEATLTKQAAEIEALKAGSIADVLAERRRQIEAEGWTLEHDDGHTNGEIANAAADWASTGQRPVVWSWATDKASRPRRRQLVIAGALILAEIERLDRAALTNTETGKP